MSVDEEYGEYLFVSYRNWIILIYSLEEVDEENSLQLIIQHNDEINSILFEIKFFEIIFIGDNKGFKIRKLKPSRIIYEDKSATCLSFCFDKNKKYLFVGFGDGIIKVFHTYYNDSNKDY